MDLDVICCCGRFDSSWVHVFIDILIVNDAEALLQDRVLVLCGVSARLDYVDVVFVALDAGRDGMVRVFENTLDDVDALFVQIIKNHKKKLENPKQLQKNFYSSRLLIFKNLHTLKLKVVAYVFSELLQL